MSNFPFAWWDKTITIFNRYVDPTTQRISWYSTVVENCFWKYVNSTYTIPSKGISLETKEVVCRIPATDAFIKKPEWDELSDKTDNFTLATGDIIVLGEVTDTIDEYVAGERSTDLLSKYKVSGECLEVDTYVNNVQTGVGLAHYRVIGK